MKTIDALGQAIFKKIPVKNKEKLLVKYLSKKNATLNQLNSLGFTLLSEAVKRADLDVVSLLLDKQADVNSQNQDGSTALMWAASQGHRALIALLIQKGAQVGLRDRKRGTAISWAFTHGHYTVARRLSLYGTTDGKETPLMRAVQSHYEDLIPELLTQALPLQPSMLNMQDQLGNTALMLAVMENAKNVVALLLEKGADLSFKNQEGQDALALAIKHGHTHIIQILSHYQASNENRQEGETLLMSAARCGHEEIVSFFLTMTKDDQIDMQNQEGNTALLLAAQNGHYNTVLLLLAKGADLEIQNKKGETALFVAAVRGYKDLVTLFLSKGAKILPYTLSLVRKHKKIEQLIVRYQMIGLDVQNGETPLMRAINLGYLDLTQVWIVKGIDLDVTDYDNKTALQRACDMWFRNQEIAVLIKAGATIIPNSQEAGYLKSRMVPLLVSCLDMGDMSAALTVLNTSLTTYSDPQLSAEAYSELRNYFLNTPKGNVFQQWFNQIRDMIYPQYIASREAARMGDLYGIQGGRLAYETLIIGLVAHTAPRHRKSLIEQLVKQSAPQGRDMLRQRLCIDYDRNAHLMTIPLQIIEQPKSVYGQETKFSLNANADIAHMGESTIGLAWKAKVSNLVLGR